MKKIITPIMIVFIVGIVFLSNQDEADASISISWAGCNWCLWTNSCCSGNIVLFNTVGAGDPIATLPDVTDFPTPPPAGSKYGWVKYKEIMDSYPTDGEIGTVVQQEVPSGGGGTAYIPTQSTKYNSVEKGIAVYYFDTPQN